MLATRPPSSSAMSVVAVGNTEYDGGDYEASRL